MPITLSRPASGALTRIASAGAYTLRLLIFHYSSLTV
jgi:hypothetical protein